MAKAMQSSRPGVAKLDQSSVALKLWWFWNTQSKPTFIRAIIMNLEKSCTCKRSQR